MGVPQDLSESVRWYRKAAEQEDAEAQHRMARFYWRGGVPRDLVQAFAWFHVAVALAKVDMRGIYSDQRDLLADEMTPEQIAEAQKLAAKYFEKYKAK